MYAVIPYRIYQPTRAGNLPIPAKPPVNRWDATLEKRESEDDGGERCNDLLSIYYIVYYILCITPTKYDKYYLK